VVADKFDRHVCEKLPWFGLAAQAVAHFARFTAVEESPEMGYKRGLVEAKLA
jgi:hypothetical protein